MAKQAMFEGAVAVEGLAELNRGLRKLDAQLPSAIKSEFKRVAETTAARISSGMPKRSGRMAGSVKPRSSANYAGIAAYGARVPYGRYVDFGGGMLGVRGVRPGGRAGASRREFIAVGRYIYPVLHEMRDETLKAAENAVETVLKKV